MVFVYFLGIISVEFCKWQDNFPLAEIPNSYFFASLRSLGINISIDMQLILSNLKSLCHSLFQLHFLSCPDFT
jgi:hypothetical protein